MKSPNDLAQRALEAKRQALEDDLSAPKPQAGKPQIVLHIVIAISELIETWDSKTHGPWQEAVAIMAWRYRINFAHERASSDEAAYRALAKRFGASGAKQASTIAQLVSLFRHTESALIKEIVTFLGGVDKLSKSGMNCRSSEFVKIKNKCSKKAR